MIVHWKDITIEDCAPYRVNLTDGLLLKHRVKIPRGVIRNSLRIVDALGGPVDENGRGALGSGRRRAIQEIDPIDHSPAVIAHQDARAAGFHGQLSRLSKTAYENFIGVGRRIKPPELACGWHRVQYSPVWLDDRHASTARRVEDCLNLKWVCCEVHGSERVSLK